MGRFSISFALILGWVSSFGQCDSLFIRKNVSRGCATVEMSAERFADFYKSKKNLKKVGFYLDSLQSELDSLKAISKTSDSLTNEKIDLLIKERKVFERGYSNCDRILSDTYKEKKSLEKKNAILKKQRNIFGGSAAGLAVILILILL